MRYFLLAKDLSNSEIYCLWIKIAPWWQGCVQPFSPALKQDSTWQEPAGVNEVMCKHWWYQLLCSVQCDFSWCNLLPSMHITKQLPHVRTCHLLCFSCIFQSQVLSFSFLLPAVRAGYNSKESHFKLFFLTFSSSFYFYSWNNFQVFLSPPHYPCPSFSSLSHIEADWVWFVSHAEGQTSKMNPLIFISLQDLISSSLSSSGSFQRGLPMWTFTG